MFRVTKIGSMAVLFSDWCKDRGVDKKLSELSGMELDQVLRRFYGSSLLTIRNAIERFSLTTLHTIEA